MFECFQIGTRLIVERRSHQADRCYDISIRLEESTIKAHRDCKWMARDKRWMYVLLISFTDAANPRAPPGYFISVPDGIVTFSFTMKNRRGAPVRSLDPVIRFAGNCGISDTSNVHPWNPGSFTFKGSTQAATALRLVIGDYRTNERIFFR